MQEKKVFELSRVSGQPASNADLVEDLRLVTATLGKATVGLKQYRRLGRYDYSTASRRFGSWNGALQAAASPLRAPAVAWHRPPHEPHPPVGFHDDEKEADAAAGRLRQ